MSNQNQNRSQTGSQRRDQPRDPETGEFLSDPEAAENEQATRDQEPAPTVDEVQERYADGEIDELGLENELDAAVAREEQSGDQGAAAGQQPRDGRRARTPGEAIDETFDRGDQPAEGQPQQRDGQARQQASQRSTQGQGMNDPQRNAQRRERRKSPPQQQGQQQSQQRQQEAPASQRAGQDPQRGQQGQGQGQAQGQGPMAGMGGGQNAPRSAQGRSPAEMATDDPGAEGGGNANSAQAMAAILGDEQTEQITIGYGQADFQFVIHEPDPYLNRDCQQQLPESYTEWVREGVEEYGGLEALQEALESGERDPQLPNVDGECLRSMHDLVVDALEHDARDQHKISPSMLEEFLRRKVPGVYSIVLAMRVMAVGAASEDLESFRLNN